MRSPSDRDGERSRGAGEGVRSTPGDREPLAALGEGDRGLGDGDRSSSSGWLRDGDMLSAEAIVKNYPCLCFLSSKPGRYSMCWSYLSRAVVNEMIQDVRGEGERIVKNKREIEM